MSSAHLTPDLDLARRAGLPDALRVLVDALPRTQWEDHANFDGMVRFWLDRHLMFRRLTALMIADTQALIDKTMEPQSYAMRLARLGNHFVADLHAHHTIEDRHFFPELARLDPRVAWGFELLEADHTHIDPALAALTDAANAAIQGAEAGPVLDRLHAIEKLLDRHLTDEEDVVVPLILKSGVRF